MVARTVNRNRHEIVAVVHTLIWNSSGTHLLLLERAHTGFMDGRHTLPGGHLQAAESVVDAAIREVREEVGLELEEARPCCVLPYRGGVNFIFSSTRWQGSAKNVEPDRCASVGWFSRDELPDTVVPWLSKALELHESSDWFYDFSGP